MAESNTSTTYVIVEKDDLVAMADSVRGATGSEEKFDVGGLKDALVAAIGQGGSSTFYGSYTPTGNDYVMSIEKFPDERDYNLLAVWAIDDVGTSLYVKYIIQSLQNGTAIRITGNNSANAYDTTAPIFPSGTSQSDNCFASFYEGSSYNAARWIIYANPSSSGGIRFKEGVTYYWVFAKSEI